MNYCDSQHHPIYKIKYKSTTLDDTIPEWIVCEICFGKPEFFGRSEEIESIISLRSTVTLEIDHLSSMTRTLAKKLKKNLLVN
ncbi:MAG: hypothetical protein HQ505_00330 [Nitrosopumilus sp.]|nr:hypothetical protein [Nitrosopumilus sp.]